MALAMLLIFVFLPGHTLGWGWKLAVLPFTTIATLVVIHGCWAGNAASRVVAWRPMRVVGLRAYSLYLWHLPIMWVVWTQLPGASKWVQAAVSLVVVVAVVHVSFELLERPVLRSRRSARRAPQQPVSAGAGGPGDRVRAS
jgi:peptidoglycan/LPS O-acetylase OafA/YrhL